MPWRLRRVKASHDLGAIELLDEHGRGVAMASLWAERTAVVALVRHFG